MSAAAKPLAAHRSGPLAGRVRVPGDKSISHRALLLGGIACGVTRITGLCEAADVLATARCIAALGAPATRAGSRWEVRGRGVSGLVTPAGELDLAGSATGARLAMGIIAGNDVTARLVGDAALSRLGLGHVLAPLMRMGLAVAEDRETLPLTLTGTARLVPIEHAMPVASAEVKSAILLAGLAAAGETTVVERAATRDHTERMLRHLGAEVRTTPRDGGTAITVAGHAELEGRDIAVPGDPSAAASLAAAAAIVPGSEVTIEGVLVNPTRTGFFATLREMGGDVAFLDERNAGGEPVADIRVRHRRLVSARVPAARAAAMIDELPALAVVAAFAEGETRLEGLGWLRPKAGDSLAATAAGLAASGADARIDGDMLVVAGSAARPVRGGGPVATIADHRIAMAFLALGLAADRPVTVDDAGAIAAAFPDFTAVVARLGGTLVAG